jgi:GT2 family glycosyltransferase
MSDVAVVVCTRNRPDNLREALESLARQSLARDRYTVVVVDNGDGSGADVAEAAGADTVLHVAEPGLSRARNAGCQASTAPVLAFLDDDAVATPEWLATGAELLRRLEATACGGPILPLYDDPPPDWFRDDYELRTWGDEERLLVFGETLSASNLFLAREALAGVGGFDPRLGMRAETVAVGEETALFRQLWQRGGFRAAYSPTLVVRHRVPARKLTVAYQLRRAAAAGDAWALANSSGRRNLERAARDAVVATGLAGRALLRAHTPWQQWAIDELSPVAGRLGSMRRALRRDH